MIAKLKIPLIIIISFFLLMLIVRIIKDANNSSVVSSRIADYIVDEGLRDTYKKVSKLRDGGPQRKIDRHAPDVTTEVLSDTDESNDNAAFSTNIEEDNFLELMKPVDSPFQSPPAQIPYPKQTDLLNNPYYTMNEMPKEESAKLKQKESESSELQNLQHIVNVFYPDEENEFEFNEGKYLFNTIENAPLEYEKIVWFSNLGEDVSEEEGLYTYRDDLDKKVKYHAKTPEYTNRKFISHRAMFEYEIVGRTIVKKYIQWQQGNFKVNDIYLFDAYEGQNLEDSDEISYYYDLEKHIKDDKSEKKVNIIDEFLQSLFFNKESEENSGLQLFGFIDNLELKEYQVSTPEELEEIGDVERINKELRDEKKTIVFKDPGRSLIPKSVEYMIIGIFSVLIVWFGIKSL